MTRPAAGACLGSPVRALLRAGGHSLALLDERPVLALKATAPRRGVHAHATVKLFRGDPRAGRPAELLVAQSLPRVQLEALLRELRALRAAGVLADVLCWGRYFAADAAHNGDGSAAAARRVAAADCRRPPGHLARRLARLGAGARRAG